jgi:hypothetical protein
MGGLRGVEGCHQFHPEFVTNFRIPAFIGVGKMVSKGFGLMKYVSAG